MLEEELRNASSMVEEGICLQKLGAFFECGGWRKGNPDPVGTARYILDYWIKIVLLKEKRDSKDIIMTRCMASVGAPEVICEFVLVRGVGDVSDMLKVLKENCFFFTGPSFEPHTQIKCLEWLYFDVRLSWKDHGIMFGNSQVWDPEFLSFFRKYAGAWRRGIYVKRPRS